MLQLLIIFIFFSFAHNIAGVLAWRFMGYLRIFISRDIRLKVFKKLQDLDMSYHISHSTGNTISIFKRGDSAVDDAIVIFHMFLWGPLITFSISLAILWGIHWAFAVSVLVFAIIFIIILQKLLSNNLKWRRAYHEQEDNITGKITDNLMNMITVKHFAKEQWEHNRLTDFFKLWTSNYLDYDKSFRYMDFISNIIATINIVLALFLGYFYFKQNVITIGDFVLLFVMITRINDELRYLVYNYREFNRSLVDVEKYINILEEEPNIKEPETKIKINNINPTIELRKVTFNYPDNTNQVFKNLSFKIKPKEKIALVGKSGAGKTTIITLLLRFYDVVSGGIYINGQNIKDFKKEELRSLFGTVPQDPIMFNETIKYNVCYGKSEATMAELIMACKLANIYNFIDSLPAKFETQVGERGIKLSGGQKQRLAIARVILSNPQIIIFDEATSQLDSESEKEIQDAFWKIAKEKTTIIIAHRLSTVIKADRIIVFDQGKIVESGTHEELLKLNRKYCKLWKIQSANISINSNIIK